MKKTALIILALLVLISFIFLGYRYLPKILSQKNLKLSSVLDAKPSSNSTSFSNSRDCISGSRKNKYVCDIQNAQAAKDSDKLKIAVDNYANFLGDKAGLPEQESKYEKKIEDVPSLSDINQETGYEKYLKEIQKNQWWRQKPNPSDLKPGTIQNGLRDLANIMEGNLAAIQAKSNSQDDLLNVTKDIADYLIYAQNQAGTGVYPFPITGRTDSRSLSVADNFLNAVQTDPELLKSVTKNGWINSDLGDSSLSFDNSLCGVAMLKLYNQTGQQKYLDSALKSADWALKEPVVPNWNFNSFNVLLLATTFQITGDKKYLDSAKEKAKYGIYPGQLVSGRHFGSWTDQHNARITYHYIILRGLSKLVSVLPKDDSDYGLALNTLNIGLNSRNQEILDKGVSSISTVTDSLAEYALNNPVLYKENKLAQNALQLNIKYLLYQLQKNKLAEPQAWGKVLLLRSKEII